MQLEDFYNFGSNSSNPLGFVESGSSSNESFYNSYTETSFQYNYTGTQLENNPYSNVQLTNHAVFGREGMIPTIIINHIMMVYSILIQCLQI